MGGVTATQSVAKTTNYSQMRSLMFLMHTHNMPLHSATKVSEYHLKRLSALRLYALGMQECLRMYACVTFTFLVVKVLENFPFKAFHFPRLFQLQKDY